MSEGEEELEEIPNIRFRRWSKEDASPFAKLTAILEILPENKLKRALRSKLEDAWTVALLLLQTFRFKGAPRGPQGVKAHCKPPRALDVRGHPQHDIGPWYGNQVPVSQAEYTGPRRPATRHHKLGGCRHLGFYQDLKDTDDYPSRRNVGKFTKQPKDLSQEKNAETDTKSEKETSTEAKSEECRPCMRVVVALF